MSKPSNLYFEKTENGTTYRIYLMDYGMDPWLCRSSLDAADEVHGDLVELINGASEKVYDSIIRNYAPVIGFDSANGIACSAVRTYINIVMNREGWTMFSE